MELTDKQKGILKRGERFDAEVHFLVLALRVISVAMLIVVQLRGKDIGDMFVFVLIFYILYCSDIGSHSRLIRRLQLRIEELEKHKG